MIRTAPPIALLLVLGACDGGGDPVQQALREASAANQAAATRTTAEMQAAAQTADQAYVAKMIAHHESAVATARVALRDSRDPEIRRMAQIVVETQTREIAELKAWTPTAAPAAN
ncbi:DUF305 domain-containing protein [Brevundimonas mediterranea]|uniref:Uncharacterized protein (DUF305 family) n=1 Tax=Brevundimonas mediterranea TaxID=74329 RepID=A0A7W6A546_9CAUL|nr:DUF305 domain-containing protein [Brevundimonas mediterranea]MBB3871895.1 uncharacterized protein (DUF305 family) [Brevundimonas mediterranea]